MKIGLVSPGYPPAVGGVERVVWELARGFAGRGIEVEVMTCDPGGRMPAETIEDGVRVHRFPTLLGDSTFSVSPALGLWLLRNAAQFTLLHAHSYHTPVALEALAAARRAGIGFVLSPYYHGSGHSPLRRLLHVPYRPIGRVMVRSAQPLVCVSRAEGDLVRRHFGADLKIAIAPSGVDVDEIVRAEPMEGRRHDRLVLAVGRLERYKGMDRVVEAFGRLPPSDQLVVIGNGPARAQLEGLVRGLGLGDRVSLLGHVPTPLLRRWLRTADSFVTLSRHESFGLVLLEAAVGGAHVVASDIPAHREVGGYVPRDWISYVTPEASPDDIAALIRGAQRHEVDADSLSGVPRWADMVQLTLAAYETAADVREPARRLTRE